MLGPFFRQFFGGLLVFSFAGRHTVCFKIYIYTYIIIMYVFFLSLSLSLYMYIFFVDVMYTKL